MDEGIYFDGRHYDALWPGLKRQNELAFFLGCVKDYGEPALELGCGTGQLTLAMAQLGINITGLDRAAPMLERARQKAGERGVKVEWVRADCRNFVLHRQFGLIFFPANALLHLLSLHELQACLATVKAHLKPNGAFAFEIFNPSLPLLTRDADQRYPVGTYPDPDGRGTVTVTETNAYDSATQINHTQWYYSTEGQSDETTSTLDLRMLYPQETEALLYYNGFDMCARYGDYDKAPFTAQSSRQLIVCTPT